MAKCVPAVGEFPLCLISINDQSSTEDGCQKRSRAQLANKRPGPLLGFDPALVDSPTSTAEPLLIVCRVHFSVSPLPKIPQFVPPEGSGICFAGTWSTLPPASL